MDIKEIGINPRNWLHSAKDRDCWRALVNEALNLQVSYVMELVIPSSLGSIEQHVKEGGRRKKKRKGKEGWKINLRSMLTK